MVSSSIILAIIAQESMGNRYAQSWDDYDSRGLMQITCQDWMQIDCDLLYDEEYNIMWGEWFFEEALTYSKGNLYIALQVYNCGPERYERNRYCGSYYADRVMYYWLPQFARFGILKE